VTDGDRPTTDSVNPEHPTTSIRPRVDQYPQASRVSERGERRQWPDSASFWTSGTSMAGSTFKVCATCPARMRWRSGDRRCPSCGSKSFTWFSVVDLGPDPTTGRRRQQQRGGFDNQNEAEQALAAARREGLPRIRPLQDYADVGTTTTSVTHASLLLTAGEPAKVVQERLGHHSPAFTQSTYQHLLPGMGEAAARRSEALLLDDASEDDTTS
jgi:hypothetical protein